MAEGEVFLDTSALLAIVNRSDALHQFAVRVQRSLTETHARLVLSDWILTEFLSAAARPFLRGAAIRVVERLRASQRTTIVEADRRGWERAFDFYAQRSDKAWSLVDCTSMLICQERGIRSVFSHDHHFEQFGLVLLLKP